MKKFALLMTLFATIFHAQGCADDSGSSALPAFGFILTPKVVAEKDADHDDNHVILAAVLGPCYNAPGAYIEAYRRDHKTHYLYSKPFKKFLKANGLKKSQFKPLEKYLKKQLKLAMKDSRPYIHYLDIYIHSDSNWRYKVDIREEFESDSDSSSTSSSGLLQPLTPTMFTFLTVPEFIKKGRDHVKVVLAAVLAPAYNARGALVQARVKQGRIHFKYSDAMIDYIESHDLSKEDFKPLQDYLKQQLMLAMDNPTTYMEYLDSYVHGGAVPSFTFTIVPSQPSSSSTSSSTSTSWSTSSSTE